MKILLLGKNGQVGWELQRTLAALGPVIALGRADLDLQNKNNISRSIRSSRPNVIVNAASYTRVDQAEEETEKARLINAEAPGLIAEEAKRIDAYIIHYSTDYVFDGSKSTPYTEEDKPLPLNVYGQSKLEGEHNIQASGASHLILRTCWVYGLRGKNFLLTIRRLAAEKEELRIVNDQVGSPTWCRMLAELTALVLARPPVSWPEGIYHASAGGETSWFGFARAILEHTGWDGRRPRLVPIPSSEYVTPALRPNYTVLSGAKLAHELGLSLPPWDHSLALALQDLHKERDAGAENLP